MANVKVFLWTDRQMDRQTDGQSDYYSCIMFKAVRCDDIKMTFLQYEF